MKKLFAVILVFATLFLCACTGRDSGTTDIPSSAASTSSVQITATPNESTTAPEIITEWGTDLLPADFPAPPEGTYDLLIGEGTPTSDEDSYTSEWIRLKFTCPEHSFYLFTNNLVENGYKGSVKKFTNATYYLDGFKGHWQNGDYIVTIFESKINLNGNYTFSIDIIPCNDNFPAELQEYFPKFNGFTVTAGNYCGHDSNNEFLESTFGGSFAPFWHWEFRFDEGFIGVEEKEFNEYCEALGKAGFAGPVVASTVDGCNVTSVDVVKTIDGISYCAYLLYNPSLKTLDIAYANNPEIYKVEG